MSQTEWIYGIHSVASVLKSQPQRLLRIHVQQGRQDDRVQKLIDNAQRENIEIAREPRKQLDKLVEGNHQGIIAECRPGEQYDEDFLDVLAERHGCALFVLVLDGVTDPHNLGACMRTAEAAGVHAVVIPRDNSASMTSTVRKVAAGAADLVPLVVVTNLSRAIKQLQQHGVWVIGAAGEATETLYQARLKTPMALVMGAEGSGMRRLTKENCDELIAIPMLGETSSLNVSVATGVCLFEVVRQNRA
ncbi:MAG: 23S rRNA (guanosine(2251)-2'-O)-methyltransferase RlmB [Cellvibrionales bacterium]|jgi:23S rRNA (guanosine2251-2'-O)-methyltransferase|nr:23S rRNA (guanosine(2251)-2'-O)-methyltransferase RlmB [Cellvibrionales bacterium]